MLPRELLDWDMKNNLEFYDAVKAGVKNRKDFAKLEGMHTQLQGQSKENLLDTAQKALLDRYLIGHVELQRGCRSALSADLFRGEFGALSVAVDAHHLCARLDRERAS